MSGSIDNTDVVAVVSDDRAEARLAAPPGADLGWITVEHCAERLRVAGVEPTPAVLETLTTLVASVRAGETSLAGQGVVVARADEPVDGVDGTVEWFVDADEGHGASGGEAEPVSYYDQSAYIMVAPGQLLGRVIEPTAGKDGRDVLGGEIRAKAGKPAEITLDDSIERDAEGDLRARIEGVLRRSGAAARVSPTIEVPQSVDFSTGNIEFSGDLIVRGGVRDRFKVRIKGDAEVGGPIEAADIECGGSLTARSGMAGRGKGTLEIGGDVGARYLDGVSGRVRGDLVVDRGTVNCSLEVGGAVRSPSGSVVGGRLVVTDEVEIGTLGSDSYVRTSVALGRFPILEAKLEELEQRNREDAARREQAVARIKQLHRFRDQLTDQTRREFDDRRREVVRVDERIAKATAAISRLRAAIDSERCVRLTVQRELHGGVLLTVVDRCYRVQKSVRGPITIELDAKGEVVFRRAGGPASPLTQIAEPAGPDESLDRARAA